MKILLRNSITAVFVLVLSFQFSLAQHAPTITSSVSDGCAPLSSVFFTDQEGVASYYWEFSNGAHSKIPKPTILFEQPGEYDVKLTATLVDKSVITIEKKGIINVGDIPFIDFSPSTDQMCLGDTFALINHSQGAISYSWDFGDGINSSEASPSHVYQDAGEFIITLVAFSAAGCSNIKARDKLIKVNAKYVLDFKVDKLTICENDPIVNFSPIGSFSQFHWDFGDGSSSLDKEPMHLYRNEGKYTVRLNAIDINGCKASVAKQNLLSYHKLQKIDYTLSDTLVCNGQSVEFNLKAGKKDAVTWYIDSAPVSGKHHFSHVFETPGEYNLSLVHKDQFGCQQILQHATSIQVVNSAKPDIAISVLEGCAPLKVSFANHTPEATDFQWAIGDSIIHKKSFEYTFEEADTIPIRVNTRHTSGCLIAQSLDNKILVHKSNIHITTSETSGCAPLETSFHLSSNKVSNLAWDFGNGAMSEEISPQISYPSPGVFYPSVSLTNEFGCTERIEIDNKIQVYDPEIEYSSPDPIYVCLFSEIRFSGDVGQQSWEWDFGDGHISNEKNPVHRYTIPGIYTVKLKTLNRYGCSTVIENYNTINVNGEIPPVFDFSTTNCQEEINVDFSIESPGTNMYIWDFGDGQIGNGSQVDHQYVSEGYYQVQVSNTDAYGCSAVSTKKILIEQDMTDCQAIDSLELEGEGGNAAGKEPIPERYTPEIEACSIPFAISLMKPNTIASDVIWDFKDGNTSTEPNPTHTYWSPGTYSIAIYVSNSSGGKDTISDYLIIRIANKKTDFQYAQKEYCDGTTVEFLDQTEDAISWEWNFGDGDFSDNIQPVKTYKTPGIYQVMLKTTDTKGCVSSSIHNIAIGNPFVNLNLAHDHCSNDSIKVSHNIEGFESYFWRFGDGEKLNSKYPSYLMDKAGIYPLSLEVVDKNNCKKSFGKVSEVGVKTIKALFEIAGPATGCNELEVKFNNLTEGATHYLWDFGNGQTSTDKNPVIKYGSGTFSITLNAYNGSCSETFVMTNAIQVHSLVATYTIDQEDICFPFKVELSDASINASEWSWDLGDGTTSKERSLQHTFHRKPAKGITLQVKDQFGCSSKINIDSLQYYETKFQVSKDHGCIPFEAVFKNNTPGSQNSFWDFGNGLTSAETNPATLFTEVGTYTVSLVTTSPTGCTDTTSMVDLMRIGNIETDFSVSFPSSLCSPLSATFTNQTTGADNYKWIFGDGSFSSAEHPSHIYTKVGVFDVQLISQNKLGCQDTMMYKDLVKTLGPEADFVLSDSTVCHPAEIKMYDKSVSAVGWQWIFGDGEASEKKNAHHTFSEAGIYSIALLATDKYGCKELVLFDSLKVVKTPEARFSIDQVNHCLPAVVDVRNESANLQHAKFTWESDKMKSSLEENPKLIFNEPGDYIISLTTTNDGWCSDTYSALTPIKIRDTTNLKEPEIMSLSVRDDQAIEIHLQPYLRNNLKHHLIYRKGAEENEFQLIDSILNPSDARFVDLNVFPQASAYSYKIQSHVFCNNPSPLNEIKTYKSIFAEAKTADRNIQIDWSAYQGHDFDDYTVWRKSEYEDWTEIGVINKKSSSFMDREELCPVNYTYKLTANNLDGNRYVSHSNTSSIQPLYNIFEDQRVEVIRTTVIDHNQVHTEWKEPEIGPKKVVGYEVFRSIDQDNRFEYINSVPAGITSYLDSEVLTDDSFYHYKIMVINTCNVKGIISNEGTSILLQKTTDFYDNTIFWTPYEGWSEGVGEYLIQKKNEFDLWETIDAVEPQQNSYRIDLSKD
ncbi:MAG: PKD domain-containing protein [Cyclobacteriaceae bacterium]|nr:PKD domain-containing protein [Cyclobacteriaceae bacterium]